jgi:hypothetical protein
MSRPCIECGRIGPCGCVDRDWEDDMREVNEQSGKGGSTQRPRRRGPKDPAKQRQGMSNRRKGGKGEREVVKLLEDYGVEASRGFGDRRAGDVRVDGLGKIEVKRTKGGFPRIERWLAGHFAVMHRADNGEWIAVLHAKDFARLCELHQQERE